MRSLVSFLCVALIASLSACTTADSSPPSVVLTWIAPVSYTDGESIPSTETINYTIFQGPSGQETQIATGVTGLTWTATQNLTAGATVCWQIQANDVEKGTSSVKTSEVCSKISPLVPNDPTGLTAKQQ